MANKHLRKQRIFFSIEILSLCQKNYWQRKFRKKLTKTHNVQENRSESSEKQSLLVAGVVEVVGLVVDVLVEDVVGDVVEVEALQST